MLTLSLFRYNSIVRFFNDFFMHLFVLVFISFKFRRVSTSVEVVKMTVISALLTDAAAKLVGKLFYQRLRP